MKPINKASAVAEKTRATFASLSFSLGFFTPGVAPMFLNPGAAPAFLFSGV
jgi:hypothetical protein